MFRISLLWLLLFFSQITHAGLTIQITEGMVAAVPLAISERSASQLSNQVASIVRQDLTRSGRIRFVNDVYERTIKSLMVAQMGGAEGLIELDLNQVGGMIELKVIYTDIIAFRSGQKAKEEQMITAHTSAVRELAHKASDIIFEAVTDIPGAFSTKLAYVTADDGRYKLEIADSDGYQPQTILTSVEPLMSPTWSPRGNQLAYVSFEQKRSEIYLQDITSGERQKLISSSGINSSPAWSPDGKQLAFVSSRNGSADIFLYDLQSKSTRQLTHHRAIDTEPSWSPNGDKILFTSSRGGRPQIYELDLNNNRVSRVTFEGSYNANASYGKDDSTLFFVHRDNGQFYIAKLLRKNNQLTVLSKTSFDESPTVAPNGQMIVYATIQNNKGVLAAVSSDGLVRWSLPTNRGEVRAPSWSPLL